MTARWTSRCSSRGLKVLALGVSLVLLGAAALLLFLGAGAPRWVGWLLVGTAVVVGVAGYLLASLEARVEDDRFVVAFGPFGLPRRVIPLAQIREVAAAQIEPTEWGGWGYRWIPWAHASAAVIRRGPGIVLGLEDGRRFAVTVDDAREGALALGHALEAARGR